jgi:glycosyltransferase involved in cell wall biosynthesis
MDFQLIIPCYNEAKSLESMLARTVFAAKNAGYTPEQFQLIIVDNGSSDETAVLLHALKQGSMSEWLQSIRIEKNLGYGDGIWCGLRASTARYIGWTHADEQCDPKDAFDALKYLLASPDNKQMLVKGARHKRDILDYLWSRFFEIVVFIMLGIYLWEINAQPKVFSRTLLAELPDPPVDFAFDFYVLLCARKARWRIESIPVIFSPRVHGMSRWAFSIKNRLKTGCRMVGYIRRLRNSGKL